MNFDVKKQTQAVIDWLKAYADTTKTNGFVLGISGGKDSTVVAALLVQAVGKERVLGVLMPNGNQVDLQDGITLCKHLAIPYEIINIQTTFDAILGSIGTVKEHTKTNIAPRIRMSILYALAQEHNYLVCGTGNASEKHIGYCTKWGDTACDLNPISRFTTDEVIAIGEHLEIPTFLTRKAPSDGLSGKTDEDNIGFSYAQLNEYIKTGVCEDAQVKEKIQKMHNTSRHKFSPIPTY